MTDSNAEIKTQTPPNPNAPDKGVEITDGSLLPKLTTSLSRAINLHGLDVDTFTERQETWDRATRTLLDLIDEGSRIAHITEQPEEFDNRDSTGYSTKFREWQYQVNKYASTIDAQAMLSNGLDPKDVADFKRRMAQTAINEGLITPEDCERLGIVFEKETTAPPEK